MPRPVVEVKGAKELRRAIRQAGDSDLKLELKKANREVADIVANEARTTIPVRSGALRDTIRASGTMASGVVRTGTKRVPYAGVIHFGWPARKIEPRPFLYEAADARVDEVVGRYETAIAAVADKLARAGDVT